MDDSDVEVLGEDVGSGARSGDADVVEFAVDSQGDGAEVALSGLVGVSFWPKKVKDSTFDTYG